MSDEMKKTIEKLNGAFEAFKSANDERIKALEKKGTVDPTITAKLEKAEAELEQLSKLKEQMEDLETKVNRPGRATGQTDEEVNAADHRKAFKRFMQKGDDSGLEEIQKKALNITTGSDGGYAVPEAIDTEIGNLLVDISPIRAIATVRAIGTSDWKKLVNTRGTASGWVGEAAARPETNTPSLAEVVPPIGEIYANPAATQTALDDVFFDAENWLADEVATEFAKQEGAAFVAGNGTNKPKGFLAYTTAATADGVRAFGTLQHVATGAAGAFATTDPHEVLIDVVYALKAGHRNLAQWVLNKSTLAEVRKMKDGDGNLIWQPGLTAGQPQTLLGYPITEAEDVPDIAADSLSIAFGNFRAGYLILDRVGIRVLRDPFTNKPYVHFYTTKRVGGGVVDSEAIKLVKFAAA